MSIRVKILASLISIILLIVIIITFSVNRIFQQSVRKSIDETFDETGQFFERIQDIQFRQLRQTAILLADNQSLKAAISTNDTSTVNAKLRDEIKYILDFFPVIPDSALSDEYFIYDNFNGLLLITDPEGIPLGQLDNRPLDQFSLAAYPQIKAALQGEYPLNSSIWKKNNTYLQAVSVPVWVGDRLLGSLTLGFPMESLEVRHLSSDTGLEIIYYIDDEIYLSSFDFKNEEDQTELNRKIHDAIFDLNMKKDAITIESEIMDENWLFYITYMNENQESGDIKGYYIVAQSLTKEMAPVIQLRYLILSIGMVVAVLAFFIGYLLTKRITNPIQDLIAGINRIERGDYQTPVQVSSKDEIGVLTNTFNNLVTNLRERLQMLKFVSEATLDAIKNTMSDIELGGKREDITVFFSDIRGFTKWSEKRTPEQVIDMINTLLRFQADIIKAHNGDIDKFVGDEVVAVFRGENKEQHAVNAAIEIQKKGAEILEQYKGEIAIGIGINTGEVVMGAMGSDHRMDYTVLGNHVNLGARLCSAAKPYQILITLAIAECLERRIEIEPLEAIRVKGIEEPVPIFDIMWKLL